MRPVRASLGSALPFQPEQILRLQRLRLHEVPEAKKEKVVATSMKYVVEIDSDDKRISETLPKLLAGGDVQIIGPWGERCRDILPVKLIGEIPADE